MANPVLAQVMLRIDRGCESAMAFIWQWSPRGDPPPKRQVLHGFLRADVLREADGSPRGPVVLDSGSAGNEDGQHTGMIFGGFIGISRHGEMYLICRLLSLKPNIVHQSMNISCFTQWWQCCCWHTRAHAAHGHSRLTWIGANFING